MTRHTQGAVGELTPGEQMARALYRAASRLLRAYRFVRRPTVRGVRCVVFHEGKILLVRHTYGDRRCAFPGGLSKRRETGSETIRRELAEELGIRPAKWRYLGEDQMTGADHGRFITSCYSCAAESPIVEPNGAEIDEVGWYRLENLPADRAQSTGDIAQLALRSLRNR